LLYRDEISQYEEKDISFSDHPTDGVRVYRKKCFEDIGGIPLTRAPETVAEAKAKMCGWKLRRFDDIWAVITRKTHHSTSLWSRCVMAGSEAHYLGYHLFLVIGHIFYELFFGRPFYRFLAYGWGYMKSLALREPKVADVEVIDYFKNQRFKEIQHHIMTLLKKAIKKK
jgi:hypothetical protein